MKIVNNRQRDTNGEPITELNYGKLKKLGDNLSTLYGKEITYSRINLLTTITSLTNKQESDLAYVLNQEGSISKLAGY